jgi:hypothetical protein
MRLPFLFRIGNKYIMSFFSINDLIHNENIRTNIFKPLGLVIYNEVYFYILLILVYCGLLFLAILGSLFYLLSIHKKLTMLMDRPIIFESI